MRLAIKHFLGGVFVAVEFITQLTQRFQPDDFLPEQGCAHQGQFAKSLTNEGDIILLDADQLEALHVPGHSPGSLCYYCKKQKFVIGGDTLFLNSIGRTDLPGGSHHDLVSHIKEKLFSLPDDVIVYPGHGPQTTIGAEKKNNPFLQDR